MNNKPHKKHDYIMKYLIEGNEEEFLELLKIDEKFIGLKPTENVDLMHQAFQLDSLIETDKKLHNIEFQSSVASKNKRRIIAIYSIISEIKYKKPVETTVVNLNAKKEGEIEEQITNAVKFKYKNQTLKSIDGNEFLNNIEHKIINNDKLTGREILILKLIYYTNAEDEIELFKRACRLVNRISNEKIKTEIQKVENYFLRSIINATEKEKGEIKMIIEPHITLEETAQQYHHNQGKIEERKEIAKSLKKDGEPIEKIQKHTGLTKKEIKEL